MGGLAGGLGYGAGIAAAPAIAAGPGLGYAGGLGFGGYRGPLAGALPLVGYPNGAVVPAVAPVGPSVPLNGHPNGALVPAEPFEVVAARDSALAALAAGGEGRAPNAFNFGSGISGLVAVGDALVPGNSVADTPEVAAAKAEFNSAFNMAMMGGAGDK